LPHARRGRGGQLSRPGYKLRFNQEQLALAQSKKWS
jgi:hypothetical protein